MVNDCELNLCVAYKFDEQITEEKWQADIGYSGEMVGVVGGDLNGGS